MLGTLASNFPSNIHGIHLNRVNETMPQVTLARGLGCPVLVLSSVRRAAYRLGEADLEGRLAAFKEAGGSSTRPTPRLLLYDLPEAVQASLNLLSHFRPMALDLCKNREGRTGRVAAKWEAQWGLWRVAQAFSN